MLRQTIASRSGPSLLAAALVIAIASRGLADPAPAASATTAPAASATTTPPPASPAEPSETPQPEPPFWSGPRVAAAIVGASGVAAIVVGSIYAGRSDASTAESKKHCASSDPDKCNPEGYSLREKATQDGRVAAMSLGVGAAAVFVSLAFGWIDPDFHAKSAPPRVSVAPVVGPGEGGVFVIGTF